jgi:hypothetical protein
MSPVPRWRDHFAFGAAVFAPRRFDRDLVTEFFMRFARMEFALKAAGFARAGRNDSIHVEWDEFADSIEQGLTGVAAPEIIAAREYLLVKPPRKQVIEDGVIQWRARGRDGESEARFLIRCITTVRNNLFHGGKEVVGEPVERNARLLATSLLVLGWALTLSPRVADKFDRLGPEEPVA